MKEDKFRPWQGIFFRLLVPLTLVLVLIFFLLHSLTMGAVSNFLDRHMRQNMQWVTSSVFEICDRNLSDFLFMTSGSMINHAIVQARTIAEIETFLEGHSLSGTVFSGSGDALLAHNLPLAHEDLEHKTRNLSPGSRLVMGGREYLTGRLDFEPWHWEIIILQDTSHYQAMLGEIKNVYWAVAGMLTSAVVFFVFLMVINVSRPLSRIMGRVEKEESPDYRGVAEFTYLSRSIERMMKSVRSRNEFISSLFDTLSAIVVVADREGRVTMVNNYLCALTGFQKQEILGHRLWEMVARKKSGFIKKMFEDHSKGLTVNGQAMSILDKSGRKIEVLWHSRMIQDRESGLEWIIFTGSDITHLKQIEKSLENERLFIYSLFESSPLAQMVISKDGQVLDTNEQFVSLTGFRAGDLQDLEAWLDRVAGDDTLWKELRSAGSDHSRGSGKSRQVRITDRFGNKQDVEFTFAPLPDGRMVVFLVDMTEKLRQEDENRRMVKELYQARKMEAIGVLAGGIAHDFNNILQAVSVQVQAMDMEDPGTGDKRKPHFQRIDSLVDRGMSIVKRILTFSRNVEPEFSLVSLSELVRQEIDLLRQTLPKMIEIRVQAPEEMAEVYIDRHQMELVLMNLINNARDSIDGSGSIEVSAREVVVDDQFEAAGSLPHGRYVLLAVKDSGHGMNEQVMDQIFDPFFTTKEPGKGTGLGLPTVYGIVQKHNGHIFCSSSPGKGTEFRIFIPVPEKQAPEEEMPAQENSTLSLEGSETILVVDDEDDIRELTMEMIESFGYRAIGAESGEKALKIFAAGGIDLVLMDLGMPGMGGEQCAAKLLDMDPQARIIIASGYMDHPMAHDPGRFGLADFISKPYQLRDALGRIRSVLSGLDQAESPPFQ